MLYYPMPDDELAARIVEELAADMNTIDLTNIADEQLANTGHQAAQRRRNDQRVIGLIAAEYYRRHGDWRGIAAVFDDLISYSTLRRWAQPFLGSN
jgi:hypothetical protein